MTNSFYFKLIQKKITIFKMRYKNILNLLNIYNNLTEVIYFQKLEITLLLWDVWIKQCIIIENLTELCVIEIMFSTNHNVEFLVQHVKLTCANQATEL